MGAIPRFLIPATIGVGAHVGTGAVGTLVVTAIGVCPMYTTYILRIMHIMYIMCIMCVVAGLKRRRILGYSEEESL